MALALLVSGACAGACVVGACDRAPGARRDRRSSSRAEGRVVARGDGIVVTVDEVEERVRRTGETKEQALDALVEESLLLRAARSRWKSDDVERQVLVQRLLVDEVERKVTATTIPREAIEAEYRRTKSRYVHPERVRVEHVLVPVSRAKNPGDVPAARALAERLLVAAKAAPAEPLEAHRALAPADVALRVESLPPFDADSPYEAPFEAAALRLRAPNEISPIVETSFGFHVIRLLERFPAERRTLAEVEPEIRTRLLPSQRRKRMAALIVELGKRAHVEVDPRALSALER